MKKTKKVKWLGNNTEQYLIYGSSDASIFNLEWNFYIKWNSSLDI